MDFKALVEWASWWNRHLAVEWASCRGMGILVEQASCLLQSSRGQDAHSTPIHCLIQQRPATPDKETRSAKFPDFKSSSHKINPKPS
ncbi:hypothetical protein [Moorena sp. SIO4G3]|uniref:hypothetical protein n=1 Tax=Moorena sp. SIO4G3 TaxID=2607821 RepID=UPI00142BE436|nr:hypothetical protein [Moorena sp. SIO4G3]NEO80985.1 hypothetical protein [Moorena sp. SIO4G3]